MAVPFTLGPAHIALLGVYVALSAVAFVTYWTDKSAARRGGRRTPESVLHAVSLAGGWPGALAGQLALRHKTRKQPFRAIFWGTVVLNCVALVALLATLSVAIPPAAGRAPDPGATGSLAHRLVLSANVVGATGTSVMVEVLCRNGSTRPATLADGQDICRLVARRAHDRVIVAEVDVRMSGAPASGGGPLGSTASSTDPLTAPPMQYFRGRGALVLPGAGAYDIVATMAGIDGLKSAEATTTLR